MIAVTNFYLGAVRICQLSDNLHQKHVLLSLLGFRFHTVFVRFSVPKFEIVYVDSIEILGKVVRYQQSL